MYLIVVQCWAGIGSEPKLGAETGQPSDRNSGGQNARSPITEKCNLSSFCLCVVFFGGEYTLISCFYFHFN